MGRETSKDISADPISSDFDNRPPGKSPDQVVAGRYRTSAFFSFDQPRSSSWIGARRVQTLGRPSFALPARSRNQAFH